MKKYIVSLLFLFIVMVEAAPLRVLHLSFHNGCINDLEEVAQALGIEMTHWKASDNQDRFEGQYLGNAIYNISEERGRSLWQRHKNYFNQFDAIITSDTARLSRIFFENGWTKPLIVWVCNRFDYMDPGSTRFGLPDKSYYESFARALSMPNVFVVPYTKIEYLYARSKNVPMHDGVIKPVGTLPKKGALQSGIPHQINKSECLFLFPRLFDQHVSYIQGECNKQSIPIYTGVYNGPDDLVDFKGVIYFPYAWSNLALFENIQRGIIHFVPSEHFIRQHHRYVRYLTLKQFEVCEWYAPENRDLFVYFDSWDDLKQKIAITNYAQKRSHILARARDHRQKTVGQWKQIFEKAAAIISW